MAQGKLRIAVIGLNNQGKDHIEAIRTRDNLTLTAVCDRQTHFQKDYDLPFYEDFDDLFASGLIDAAIVAVPHDLHLAVVRSAATHGVHLLKEKPLGRTLAEALEITRLAENNIVLHTGVQRRHHLTYAALKQELKGKVIRSVSLEMTVIPSSKDPHVWRANHTRAGGGVLNDLGYHAVDLLHFLIGPMDPISCTTFLNQSPSGTSETEDEVRVWARTHSAWVRMMVGRAQQKKETIWIQTDQGDYEASREKIVLHRDNSAVVLQQSPRDWNHTLQNQLDTLVHAVKEQAYYQTDPPEQMPTIRFIEQCYALLRARGLPGDLPQAAEHRRKPV